MRDQPTHEIIESVIRAATIHDVGSGPEFPRVGVADALLEAGVIVIEGLDLDAVPPGEYEIICLPLKLKGADGAPARVLLREL